MHGTITTTRAYRLAGRIGGRKGFGGDGERFGQPSRIDDEFRDRLAGLVSDWSICSGVVAGCTGDDGEPIEPDPGRARRLERQIRTMINGLPGTVFNFSGIAIWTDRDTPAGTIRHAEMIVIS